MHSPIMKWLTPVLLIHSFFVSVLAVIVYRTVDSQIIKGLWILSLLYETNIAVWWSGFCLMAASILFYRLFSLSKNFYDQIMWLVISMMLFALCLDELASFHERAHLLFGWLGLGIIGLVGFVLLSFSIVRLYLGDHNIWTPTLILISLCLFAGVAGLEYFEHNVSFNSEILHRLRMVSEESIELVAKTLFLMAAYLEYIRHHQPEYRFQFFPNPITLKYLAEILLGLLIIQIFLIILFDLDYVPPVDKARVRGYLVFVYPMLCYLFCAYLFLNTNDNKVLKHKWYAVIFFIISIASLFNLGYFIKTFIYNDLPVNMYASFHAHVMWLTLPLLAMFATLNRMLACKLLAVSVLLYFLCVSRAQFHDAFYLYTSVIGFYSFYQLRRYFVKFS